MDCPCHADYGMPAYMHFAECAHLDLLAPPPFDPELCLCPAYWGTDHHPDCPGAWDAGTSTDPQAGSALVSTSTPAPLQGTGTSFYWYSPRSFLRDTVGAQAEFPAPSLSQAWSGDAPGAPPPPARGFPWWTIALVTVVAAGGLGMALCARWRRRVEYEGYVYPE